MRSFIIFMDKKWKHALRCRLKLYNGVKPTKTFRLCQKVLVMFRHVLSYRSKTIVNQVKTTKVSSGNKDVKNICVRKYIIKTWHNNQSKQYQQPNQH